LQQTTGCKTLFEMFLQLMNEREIKPGAVPDGSNR